MLLVDSALLDLTEWLCRRFQVLTGRTNVWLAFQSTNFSIVVFFVWAGMHFRIGGRPFRIALAAFCGGLLYLLTQTLFKVPVETYENNEYRRVSRGFRNPRRVRDALLRIAFLTFGRERWDSLTLLTPNWFTRLPNYSYSGDDPNGFLGRDEIVQFFADYASLLRAPIESGFDVTRVHPRDGSNRIIVRGADGTSFDADNVVVARLPSAEGAAGQQAAATDGGTGSLQPLSQSRAASTRRDPRSVRSEVYFFWASGGSTRVVRISSMALAPMQRM